MSISQTDTRIAIQKLNELPPMSTSAQEFLAASDNPDIEIREFARIIERDPALMARLISLANAAYFGLREPVTTAEEAIFKVLGLKTAKSMALSIILAGTFSPSRAGFPLDDYWLTAVTTAMLAQRIAPLAKSDPRPDAGEAYLAGLLHSIGRLVLAHLFPEEMHKVSEHHERDYNKLVELEQEYLGVDHVSAGSWLARKWHLPAPAVAVIEHYRTKNYQGEYWPDVVLVRASLDYAMSLDHDPTAQFDSDILNLLKIDTERAEIVTTDLLAGRDEIRSMARMLAN